MSIGNLTARQLHTRIAKAQKAMSKAVAGMISVGLGNWKHGEIEAERGKGNKWIDAYLAAWDAEKVLYAESDYRRGYHGSLKRVKKNPRRRKPISAAKRREFAVRMNAARTREQKRRAGLRDSENAPRKKRRGNPVHSFQVVRWNDGHAWFWDGHRWSANRSTAALYRTVPVVKAVARALNVKCAVVTQGESAGNIERFLTGRSPKE